MSRRKIKAEEMKLAQQVLIRLTSAFCKVSRDISQYHWAVLFIGTISSGGSSEIVVGA